MIDLLGNRQKELLRLLLKNKGGLTVDELSTRLGIARNAVRQHLAALATDGLVMAGPTRPSGGRPEQLHLLTDKGKEIFPRHYSWFAQLLVEAVEQEHGTQGLGDRLEAIGKAVALRLRGQHPDLKTHKEMVEQLAEVMDGLGYDARVAAKGAAPTIEADNCVFHHLAMQNPEICRLDLALLGTFTESRVDHEECMARGGKVCRFKFTKP